MESFRNPQAIWRTGNSGGQEKKLPRWTFRSDPVKSALSNTAKHVSPNSKSLPNGKTSLPCPISKAKPNFPITGSCSRKTVKNLEIMIQKDKKSISNQKSSTVGATTNRVVSSRRLFVANDSFKSLNESKPCLSPTENSIKVASNSRFSLRSAYLNPRKHRKAIDEKTFISTSKTHEISEDMSRSVEGKSIVPQACDNSVDFSDWEIIDWPWVTPFEPLYGIPLFFDIKKNKSLPITNSVDSTSIYLWDSMTPHYKLVFDEQSRARFPLLGNCATTYLLKEKGCYPTNTKKAREDNLEHIASVFSNSRKSSSCRRRLTKSEPAPQTFVEEPAVISAGPVHSIQNENHNSKVGRKIQLDTNLEGDESPSRSLLENIHVFTKSVIQMRKADRRLIRELLEVLRKTESDDYYWSECQDQDEKDDMEFKDIRARLNPNVPDFETKSYDGAEDNVEQMRTTLQQATNLRLVSLQKSQACNHYKKKKQSNARKSTTQALAEKIKPKHKWYFETGSNPELIHPEVSSTTINNFEDKLLETSLSKIHTLEYQIQKQPILPLEMPNSVGYQYFPAHNGTQLDRSFCYSEINEDGPGRVANALDHSWAMQMLEKFKDKYPMTGVIKSYPVTNIKKKLVSDIQQRLEFLLLVKKEKEVSHQL